MPRYLMEPEGGYAWIVTKDHDYKPREGFPSRVDWSGPCDAPELLLRLLKEGKGRRWRTLYDKEYDGQLLRERKVHEGLYLDFDDLVPAEHGETAFPEVAPDAQDGPLKDLSEPDCGAAVIQFWDSEQHKWVTR